MQEFTISTTICFGEEALKKLEELVNKNILIVCDKFINSSGMVDKVKNYIHNCNVAVFDEVIPDPTVKIVAMGVQVLKNENIDLIIALGGGSSIDGAKAIREYYNKLNKDHSKKIEFYAIPTTSGTGSEVTEYSVITNEAEHLKYALTSKELLPTVAILDADLIKSVPKSITADTGMDVITHAIEAYVSKGANDFTDAFAEKAFSLAIENLEKAYLEGENLYYRERMHNASCLAGLAFNNAGLGITHSIAHAIGGKLHIPHGKINAIILPYVIEYNSDCKVTSYVGENCNLATKKYQKLARIIGLNSCNPVIGANNLVRYISELNKKLGIPKNLKELGKNIEDINKFKEEVYKALEKDVCTKSNPKEVSQEEIFKILDKVIG